MFPTTAFFNGFSKKVHFETESKNEDATKELLQDTSWADGLRGIAAVFVMFSHMTLCFARYTAQPARSEMGPSYWLQRPYLRLVGQGPAWVACFFILSGFVNALKPIKLARTGQVDTALSNMAISSFRRSFRLFLPATAATIFSWFICQFGAYETARNSDAYWVQFNSPKMSPSWGVAVEDLIRAIQTTWTYNPSNPYDQPQWALLYFLQGSMIVFCGLLVTVSMTPRWRVLTMIGCWFWSWNWGIRLGDPMVGVNMFAGILFAELQHSNAPGRIARYSLFIFPPLIALALLFMSFPSEYQHFAPWSLTLFKWHVAIAPEFSELMRFWPTIGAQLLCLTIICSPHLRRFLRHPVFLWLGKVSFPMYLIHGTLMRSLLSWLLFAGQKLSPMEEVVPLPRPLEPHPGFEDEDIFATETVVVMRYPLPGPAVFVSVLPIFFVVLGVTIHYWTTVIEPYFGLITKKAEDIMLGKEKRAPTLPIRHD